MKEIVYNNNDYDVYTLGDSTIITPKGHGGQLMSAEALLLALKNNRAVTSYPSLIDEVREIIARLEVVEGKEVIIIEPDNIPTSIEDRILPNGASESPVFNMDYREYMAREDRYNDKPKIQRKHGRKKSWSRDNRKKR